MKRVIDIPDEKYIAIKKCFENGCALGVTDMAVLNGTPLLEGHEQLLADVKQLLWDVRRLPRDKDGCLIPTGTLCWQDSEWAAYGQGKGDAAILIKKLLENYGGLE